MENLKSDLEKRRAVVERKVAMKELKFDNFIEAEYHKQQCKSLNISNRISVSFTLPDPTSENFKAGILKNYVKVRSETQYKRVIHCWMLDYSEKSLSLYLKNHRFDTLFNFRFPNFFHPKKWVEIPRKMFTLYLKILPKVLYCVEVSKVTIRKGQFQRILVNIFRAQELIFHDCCIESSKSYFKSGGEYNLKSLMFRYCTSLPSSARPSIFLPKNDFDPRSLLKSILNCNLRDTLENISLTTTSLSEKEAEEFLAKNRLPRLQISGQHKMKSFSFPLKDTSNCISVKDESKYGIYRVLT